MRGRRGTHTTKQWGAAAPPYVGKDHRRVRDFIHGPASTAAAAADTATRRGMLRENQTIRRIIVPIIIANDHFFENQNLLNVHAPLTVFFFDRNESFLKT